MTKAVCQVPDNRLCDYAVGLSRQLYGLTIAT